MEGDYPARGLPPLALGDGAFLTISIAVRPPVGRSDMLLTFCVFLCLLLS